jgi:Bacterial PH domain
MDFMIRQEGRELGPYTESEIRTRLVIGTIALSDFARSDGAMEWMPLFSFPQFSSSNREPRANSSPSPPPPPIPMVSPSRPDSKALGSYTAATLQENEQPLHHTAIPLGILASAIVTVRTSELVITDRRVLIKVGFIKRHTFEMFISKIESVAVFQSMMGRLFDYGTVTIRGTGGSSESFTTIAAPLQFRDAIQLVQSNSEGR